MIDITIIEGKFACNIVDYRYLTKFPSYQVVGKQFLNNFPRQYDDTWTGLPYVKGCVGETKTFKISAIGLSSTSAPIRIGWQCGKTLTSKNQYNILRSTFGKTQNFNCPVTDYGAIRFQMGGKTVKSISKTICRIYEGDFIPKGLGFGFEFLNYDGIDLMSNGTVKDQIEITEYSHILTKRIVQIRKDDLILSWDENLKLYTATFPSYVKQGSSLLSDRLCDYTTNSPTDNYPSVQNHLTNRLVTIKGDSKAHIDDLLKECVFLVELAAPKIINLHLGGKIYTMISGQKIYTNRYDSISANAQGVYTCTLGGQVTTFNTTDIKSITVV